MKSTGIVRKVDDLGRIVLPMELRRAMDIHTKDDIEIFVDGDRIILKKYQPKKSCQVTGVLSDDNMEFAGGKIVLSPEGAKILMEELESELSVKNN